MALAIPGNVSVGSPNSELMILRGANANLRPILENAPPSITEDRSVCLIDVLPLVSDWLIRDVESDSWLNEQTQQAYLRNDLKSILDGQLITAESLADARNVIQVFKNRHNSRIAKSDLMDEIGVSFRIVILTGKRIANAKFKI
jgi:hypothetical protein